jgi:hypothetical protein
VGPRAGLDTDARGKIGGSNPDRPVVQPVVRHYTAWANPAPPKMKVGLSNHQPVCVCVPLITVEQIGGLS